MVGEMLRGAAESRGDEPVMHKVYGEHISSEFYDPSTMKFNVVSKQNHWLDCLAGNYMAAARLGITLRSKKRKKKKQAKTETKRAAIRVLEC